MMKGMSTVKVGPSLAKVLVLFGIFILPLCASAQSIPSDPITDNMQRYLQYLNIPGYTEGKMTHQLEFMQKVRNLWSREKFQELRHKSLKEILENEVGNSLFVSAVAFHEGMVEQAEMDIASYHIAQDKKEQVRNMIIRAVQFRDGLRQYGEPRFKQIESLDDEIRWVTSVFFSPDGKYLSTGGSNGTTLWSLSPKSKVRTNIFGESSRIEYAPRMAHSKDGRLEAIVVKEGFLRNPVCILRDSWTWQEIGIVELDRDAISNFVSFSPDGTILAWKYFIQVNLKAIELWDVKTQKKIHTINNDSNSIAFSPDGKVLASGDEYNISLWDLISLKENVNLSASYFRSPVSKLTFSPDGTLLAFAQIDGDLKLWDVVGQREVLSLSLPGTTDDLTFSPDGSLLAVAGVDGIIVFDIKTKKEISRLEWINENDGKARFYSISFNADGSLLAAGARHATLIFSNRTQVDPDLNLIYLADPDHREDR